MTRISQKLSGTGATKAFAALACIALLAVLVPSPARILISGNTPPSTAELRFPASERAISQSDIDKIIARPLFNAGRKRDLPQRPDGPQPGLDTYRISGILLYGSSAIAIIERKATKVSLTLKLGDTLDGRSLTAITADGVIFSSALGQEVLSIPKIAGAALVQPIEDHPNNQRDKLPNAGDKRHQ